MITMTVMDCVEDIEDECEESLSMAMDVDDDNSFKFLGDRVIASNMKLTITDADFFNSFEDDFDDSSIN